MDCQAISERLSAYLDGELPAHEAVAVQQHLHSCPSCRRLAKDWASLSTMMKSAFANLDAPPWLETRVMQRIRSLGPSRQRVRLKWLAVCSALAVTVLAVGGGFTFAWSVLWSLITVSFRLLHETDLVLLRLLFGQGWVLRGTVAIGVVITLGSFACLTRVMRNTLHSGLSP